MPASKVEAALAWAGRGFRVFPLRENGKRPIWEGWTETATTDPATIRAWWDGTEYNIGVLTTGLLGVDIDRKDGKDGMIAWRRIGGSDDTLTVRTPSGGLHLYFWGADVSLSAGGLGDGLDIRSHNGFFVAPGSTIDGRAYEVVQDVPMRRAPEAIVSLCRPAGQARTKDAAVPLVDLDTPVALALAQQRIAAAPGADRGQQSDEAFKLAARVKDCGVSEVMCGVLMQEWASRCNPPIGAADLEYRIENAYRYGQNRPGTAHPEAQFGAVAIPPPPEPAPPPPAVPEAAAAALFTFGNAVALMSLAPRPHILRRFLLAGDVTALLASGGVGKSLLTLTVAAHLAIGADFCGFENALRRPARSIIYNAEDSLDEMSMRLHAICTVHNLPFDQVSGQIALISGKTHGRFRLAEMHGRVATLNDEAIGRLTAAASDPEVALLAMDPLNKLHAVQGNDNVEMTFVMEAIERIAEQAQVAVLLSHHVSKAATGFKRAGNAESSMGAQSVVNSARAAFTLTPPDDDDAKTLGLRDVDRRLLVRLDDAKANRWLASGKALWFQKQGVKLWNGEEVGALEAVDISMREAARRLFIAKLLYDNMKGSEMALKEAADTLLRNDPMMATLSVAKITNLIETTLAEPVLLPGSGKVGLSVADGAKKVTKQ